MKDSVLKEGFETVSPISIEAGPTSIRVGVSRRFLLFRFLNWLTKRIEEDPHLNFLSILKSYKALGSILDGSLHELHRDRKKLYFRNFFIDGLLYRTVASDLEWVHSRVKHPEKIKLTITKRGVIVYDNYQEGAFNVLLLTLHSGSWMRRDIRKLQKIASKERFLEEDIDSHKLYADLVLKKGGIWIDNKGSRFACDYNRTRERAIYENKSEEWLAEVWRQPLTREQRIWLLAGYDEFYHTLESLVKTHHFNIIFDAHTMKDAPGRADLSFGTKYIPRFYMPIVFTMLAKLRSLGYANVELDKPFKGGNILRWMSDRFPNRFVFSMEVNKKLYMNESRTIALPHKCEKLAADLNKIFDIDTKNI